jgi:hypothetical protein
VKGKTKTRAAPTEGMRTEVLDIIVIDLFSARDSPLEEESEHCSVIKVLFLVLIWYHFGIIVVLFWLYCGSFVISR